ncbi:MAG: NAD(P)-binding domain-containing protein [Thermococci archaeon]|nr:NAD(P)-binding domain-containing protein [Thermococci archaeon]
MTGEKPRVLVLFKIKSRALKELKKYAEVDVLPYPDEELLISRIGSYDAVLVSPLNRMTREVIESGRRLKVISCHSAGYDNVDIDAATERGIYVTKVSGWLSEAVAEFAVGLTVDLLRKIVYTDRFVREGNWKSHREVWSRFKSVETLYGKKVGILGMGAIGKAIARRMKAMGTELFYWSRSRKPDIEEETGAEYLPVEEVIKRSDIVILALPATKDTHHIINGERLRHMRGKYLVNIGRGSLVDEAAVTEALKEGILKGYATDVFEDEPVQEHELFDLSWETVLTPHYAGLSIETLEDMGMRAVENLISILRGEYIDDIVNKEVMKIRPLKEVKML